MTTRFYDPADPMPAALTLIGAVVLAGTLGYVVLVPAPTTKGIVARARTKEREIQIRIDEAKEQERQMQALLSKRKIALSPDAIGPDVLARITRLAQAGGLRLTGFRPQRPMESATGVTIYPFSVTAGGTFPATAKFVRSVETATSDIAVTSYSASTADQESSSTVAIIGIAVFGDTPKRPTSRPATGTGTAPAATGTTTRTTGATNG